MQSKYKRIIIAVVLFVVGLFPIGIGASFAFGFGVGVGGGTSAGALYWIGAAIIVAPLLYIFVTELIQWTRNYEEAEVQAVDSQDQTAAVATESK